MEENKMQGPIPYTDLTQMHQYYKNNIGRVVNQQEGRKETTSVWFEMNDALKNFLQNLLKPENNISGLRVYLCQYDPAMGAKIPPGYQNRMTVAMIGTVTNNGKEENSNSMTTDQQAFTGEAYNTGKICPPDICP